MTMLHTCKCIKDYMSIVFFLFFIENIINKLTLRQSTKCMESLLIILFFLFFKKLSIFCTFLSIVAYNFLFDIRGTVYSYHLIKI